MGAAPYACANVPAFIAPRLNGASGAKCGLWAKILCHVDNGP